MRVELHRFRVLPGKSERVDEHPGQAAIHGLEE
jgi:hypothetical protein